MAMTVVCLVKGVTRTNGNARSVVYIICFVAIVSGGIVWTSVGGSAVETFWVFMPFANFLFKPPLLDKECQWGGPNV